MCDTREILIRDLDYSLKEEEKKIDPAADVMTTSDDSTDETTSKDGKLLSSSHSTA